MTKKIFNKKWIIILLCLLLILASMAGIIFGSVALPLSSILECMMNHDTSSTAYILITTVRLPRVLGGILAGAGLACAGVILQGVMNNALASPNTIGVNSGAGFSVMLAMLLFPNNIQAIPVFAFLGALLTTLFIYALAYFADSSRTTIILAGITVSSFLSAGINTLKLVDSDLTINLTSFMIGSLSGLTLQKLAMPGFIILPVILFSICSAKALNLLNLGDDIARSLGLPIGVTRFILLMFASLLAGSVVSFAGLLGFVGLIVPHICRTLFGNDARFLMPCSALLGSSFVLLCDLVGRTLFSPFELPVGIIMSFIGGPFLLYLLMKKKGGRRVNA